MVEKSRKQSMAMECGVKYLQISDKSTENKLESISFISYFNYYGHNLQPISQKKKPKVNCADQISF